MLCARHWASGDWLNARTNASGMMVVTLCATYGHAIWAVVLIGGLEHGLSLPKCVRTYCVGCQRMGKGPMAC